MNATVEDHLAAVERAARVLGSAVRRSVPLGALTTYRVGGTAALAVTPASEDELLRVADAVQESGVSVLVVGRGSNLLVADAGFPGLAVIVGEAFDTVAIEGTLVRAGGGTSLPVLARRTAAASLAGLEWAAGIPGSVGGGVRMNAGGHGSDTAAVLERARVVGLTSGKAEWRVASALHLAYRSSDVAAADVVVAAELRCRPGDRGVSEALIADIVRWRRVNQPGGQNAGSVFSNPDGDSAGRLIDQAGLKGFRIGSASVSTKHANFIQADEDGSADDVLAVLRAVHEAVRERAGVDLRTEVRLIGYPGTYPHVVDDGDARG